MGFILWCLLLNRISQLKTKAAYLTSLKYWCASIPLSPIIFPVMKSKIVLSWKFKGIGMSKWTVFVNFKVSGWNTKQRFRKHRIIYFQIKRLYQNLYRCVQQKQLMLPDNNLFYNPCTKKICNILLNQGSVSHILPFCCWWVLVLGWTKRLDLEYYKVSKNWRPWMWLTNGLAILKLG